MKTLKVVALVIVALMVVISTACADRGYYAKEGLVDGWVKVDGTDLRIVTVIDEEGNLWDFFDDEDFFRIGDVVILRMHDLSDEREEADEIEDVMLIERLDWHGMMDWMESKGLI